MFMFQAHSFIDELTAHSPNIVTSINNAVNNVIQDLDFIRLEKQAFESSPSALSTTLLWKNPTMLWLCHWTHSGTIFMISV